MVWTLWPRRGTARVWEGWRRHPAPALPRQHRRQHLPLAHQGGTGGAGGIDAFADPVGGQRIASRPRQVEELPAAAVGLGAEDLAALVGAGARALLGRLRRPR